jgi:hypothetical protein
MINYAPVYADFGSCLPLAHNTPQKIGVTARQQSDVYYWVELSKHKIVTGHLPQSGVQFFANC